MCDPLSIAGAALAVGGGVANMAGIHKRRPFRRRAIGYGRLTGCCTAVEVGDPVLQKEQYRPLNQKRETGCKACRDIVGLDAEDDDIGRADGERICGHGKRKSAAFSIQFIDDSLAVEEVGAPLIVVKHRQPGFSSCHSSADGYCNKAAKGAWSDDKDMHAREISCQGRNFASSMMAA